MTCQTTLSIKMTVVVGTGDVGRTVGSVGLLLLLTILLHAAGAVRTLILVALVLSFVIVAFPTDRAEVGSPEKPCDGRQGVIMTVVVQQTEQSVAVTIGYDRIRPRGIDD